MAKLTPKQKVFCEEYIIDLNGTQAAIRAGYSANSAKEIAYEHLTKPHIQDLVQELQAERSERTQVTSDYVFTAITETIERCRQNAKPLFYKGGEPILTETQDGGLARA